MEIKFTRGLKQDARAIRETVFVQEQGFKNEFDDIDQEAYHLVLYDNGKAIATARTFVEGEDYIIGRVAVLKEYRGKHLGKKVLLTLEEKIKEQGGTRLRLSAQKQASGFYQTLGYQMMGEIYYDEHCPHITMVKEI